jgi:hypothetical protein
VIDREQSRLAGEWDGESFVADPDPEFGCVAWDCWREYVVPSASLLAAASASAARREVERADVITGVRKQLALRSAYPTDAADR